MRASETADSRPVRPRLANEFQLYRLDQRSAFPEEECARTPYLLYEDMFAHQGKRRYRPLYMNLYINSLAVPIPRRGVIEYDSPFPWPMNVFVPYAPGAGIAAFLSGLILASLPNFHSIFPM